jgi:hypothetical protein
MRLLVEIFIIAGLIYFGWDKTFRERVADLGVTLPGNQTAATAQGATAAPPTQSPGAQVTARMPLVPTRSPPGAWMWDPKHRSVLDRPAYNQTGPAPSATPPR